MHVCAVYVQVRGKYETCVLFPQCDVMLEQYEEVIEDWYKGSQEEDLTHLPVWKTRAERTRHR